jgi:hypothetical protein
MACVAAPVLVSDSGIWDRRLCGHFAPPTRRGTGASRAITRQFGRDKIGNKIGNGKGSS